jgi:hypothetical protein
VCRKGAFKIPFARSGEFANCSFEFVRGLLHKHFGCEKLAFDDVVHLHELVILGLLSVA